MNYFKGHIKVLKENQIFVFDSNLEGKHDSGTSKFALDNFGAIYGNGRGAQGHSYALATQNITPCYYDKITHNIYFLDGYRSVTEREIINNIKELYKYAREHSDKEFLIAYTKCGIGSSGYSGDEMLNMFACQDVPSNVFFSDTFKLSKCNENNIRSA